MILSDNETAIDLLNNKAIANTISDVIRGNSEQPISIGLHGDWGAGKSSILLMIEEKFIHDNEVLCVKFNGWKFQGFGDAKISIIEGIITELSKSRSQFLKSSDIVQRIFKRINWFKLAKLSSQATYSLVTGLPTINQLKTIHEKVVGSSDNSTQSNDNDQFSSALNAVQESIESEDPKKLMEEFEKFNKEFESLLRESKVKQLIILIDDLDRCLPEIIIETLEAIRLFLFIRSTAFVIAVDEAMVEYSVQKYFPMKGNSLFPKEYARSYLEKLIQVPFRIPALGVNEAKIYVTLLLIGSRLGEQDCNYKKLVEETQSYLKKPWDTKGLEVSILKEVLGTRTKSVNSDIVLSNQISPILARGTLGNPRQIKRFLNALNLRHKIAKERGFGDEIKIPILAKLMLAERFHQPLFEKIASSVSSNKNGFCQELIELESEELMKNEKLSTNRKKSEQLNKQSIKTNVDSKKHLTKNWITSEEVRFWIKLKPSFENLDLRPYLFVTKDNYQFDYTSPRSSHLINLTDKLFGPKIGIHSNLNEIKQLSGSDAYEVFQMICERIVQSDDFMKTPDGVEGLTLLVKEHPFLQTNLVDFLETFPIENCGTWLATGWNSIISEKEVKLRFQDLLNTWLNFNNAPLKKAAELTISMMKELS